MSFSYGTVSYIDMGIIVLFAGIFCPPRESGVITAQLRERFGPEYDPR